MKISEAITILETQPYERADFATYDNGRMCAMGCILRGAGFTPTETIPEDQRWKFRSNSLNLNIWIGPDGSYYQITVAKDLSHILNLPESLCARIMALSDIDKMEGPEIAEKLQSESWPEIT